MLLPLTAQESYAQGMDDETNQIVAGEVRAWLARRQRSARSVAQELGWTEIYLNRRIRGVVPFDVNDLARLAKLLDVPVTAFFEPPTIGQVMSTNVRRPGSCPPGNDLEAAA